MIVMILIQHLKNIPCNLNLKKKIEILNKMNNNTPILNKKVKHPINNIYNNIKNLINP